MAHHMRSGIPLQAPPPPSLNDSHGSSSRDSRHSRYGRSRSRSPPPRSRGSVSMSRSRYDDERRNYMENRDRRRRSPSPYGSSKVVKEEPTSSSHPTYISSSQDPRSIHQPQINRIRPPDPNENTIVRTIISPENVKIPRRENEGLRPIFEREELREAIKRRIESGDNDHNPCNPEQRVVAIIREPLPMAPQFMQQEIIPILPQGFIQEQMMQHPQPQGRFETSTGVTYSFGKARTRSRSRSPPGRPDRGKDRERERRAGSPPDRRERRVRQGSGDFRGIRRGPVRRSRSRSRSSSPVVRVDRVRIVNSYTLMSPNHSPEPEVGQGRDSPWYPIRGHQSDRIQLAKAYAAEGSSSEDDHRSTKTGVRPRGKVGVNPGADLVDSMVKTSRDLNGEDYKQLMIRLFDKQKSDSTIAGIWKYWKRQKGLRDLKKKHFRKMYQKLMKKSKKSNSGDPVRDDVGGEGTDAGDGTSSKLDPALWLSKTRRGRKRGVSPNEGVITCWHCNNPGHHRDECKVRQKEIALAQGKVWTTTRCIYCNRMGHYSEDCWFKGKGKPPRN